MPVPDVGWDRDDLTCREDIFLGLRGNHGSARKNEQRLIVFMRMGTVTRTRFKKDHQHGNFTRPTPNLNKLLAGYTLNIWSEKFILSSRILIYFDGLWELVHLFSLLVVALYFNSMPQRHYNTPSALARQVQHADNKYGMDSSHGPYLLKTWGTHICTRWLQENKPLSKPEYRARLVYFSRRAPAARVGADL
jgi:hypothetical protein